MHITSLNEELLMEMDFENLKKSYERSVLILRDDIHNKINLDVLKEFILNWRSFARKYTHNKKRISEIQAKGVQLIKYIDRKISDLRQVVYVSLEEVEPLIDYLNEFKVDILNHIKIEKTKYDQKV